MPYHHCTQQWHPSDSSHSAQKWHPTMAPSAKSRNHSPPPIGSKNPYSIHDPSDQRHGKEFWDDTRLKFWPTMPLSQATHGSRCRWLLRLILWWACGWEAATAHLLKWLSTFGFSLNRWTSERTLKIQMINKILATSNKPPWSKCIKRSYLAFIFGDWKCPNALTGLLHHTHAKHDFR